MALEISKKMKQVEEVKWLKKPSQLVSESLKLTVIPEACSFSYK